MLVLQGRNLEGIDLSGLDLSYASFYGANLSEANLSYADMSEANLSEANLSGANLIGANLVEAYLVRATLCNANLNSANLALAYLSKADLNGADLSGTNLNGTDLSGVNLSQSNLGQADSSEVNQGNFVTNLFRGRINRRSYLVGSLVSYSAFLVPLFIFSRIPLTTVVAAIIGLVVLLLGWMAGFLFSISLTIRRFHDFNKSGSYYLWLFVPFINVYFEFLLFFEEGTVGLNRYGPPPRPSIELFPGNSSSQFADEQ